MKDENFKDNCLIQQPPSAIIPQEIKFKSELCGADAENYVYIRVYSPSNMKNYFIIKELLKYETAKRLRKKHLPENKIYEGLYVVIKDGYRFCRARVISKDDFGVVTCFKIDDGVPVTTVVSNIYQIFSDDLDLPMTALKCRLEGLELFNGFPTLGIGFRMTKMGELEDDYYNTFLLSMEGQVPLIRMTLNGSTLTTEIQKWIPDLCTVPIPEEEVPMKVEIVHASSDGFIWFHYVKNNELLCKIQDILQTIDPMKLQFRICSANLRIADEWKRKYFDVPTGIFICKFYKDENYYRVRLTKPINKEKVEVEFIDYGNRAHIERDKLIVSRDVDENLAFVSPQCVKARLKGHKKLDVIYFWSILPKFVDIVVSKSSPEDTELEVQVFNCGTDDLLNFSK